MKREGRSPWTHKLSQHILFCNKQQPHDYLLLIDAHVSSESIGCREVFFDWTNTPHARAYIPAACRRRYRPTAGLVCMRQLARCIGAGLAVDTVLPMAYARPSNNSIIQKYHQSALLALSPFFRATDMIHILSFPNLRSSQDTEYCSRRHKTRVTISARGT